MNAGGYCRHTCGQCCWGGKRRALLQAETDTVPASGDAAPSESAARRMAGSGGGERAQHGRANMAANSLL